MGPFWRASHTIFHTHSRHHGEGALSEHFWTKHNSQNRCFASTGARFPREPRLRQLARQRPKIRSQIGRLAYSMAQDTSPREQHGRLRASAWTHLGRNHCDHHVSIVFHLKSLLFHRVSSAFHLSRWIKTPKDPLKLARCRY